MRCLVENGADVNARLISDLSTPLIVACYNDRIDVVSYLVENGADIHLGDNIGNTALHVAAKRRHVELVAKLRALGAEQKQNHKCLTPLIEASNDCRMVRKV